MKKTQGLRTGLNTIVVAMMAISHNRIDYPAGSVLEVSAQDVTFLRMSGAVREPTSDELKAYEARQTLATVTATEPDDTDHAGLQSQPPSDIEPDTSVINAPKPPTTEAHHITPPVDNVQTIGLPVTPEAVANPYQGWLKKDLNAELDKRGIEHDATALNDDLEELLNADDAKQANA